MTDNRTPESRSALMARIGGKNTAPEMIVRRLLHGLGYRFRLHRKDLPGTPDIVLPGRRTTIFVHGCFWHAHGCKIGQAPKSRLEYWLPKLQENQRRDAVKQASLEALGWRVLTIWQCETRDPPAVAALLDSLLSERHGAVEAAE
ncbi:MAG: DNA mismatch endonuclease Vsr [Rhodospirillales bacterium]